MESETLDGSLQLLEDGLGMLFSRSFQRAKDEFLEVDFGSRGQLDLILIHQFRACLGALAKRLEPVAPGQLRSLFVLTLKS